MRHNLGEQAVRIPKVKQKVSGGLRIHGAPDTFCTIRAYLATLHKQGVTLFSAPLTSQGPRLRRASRRRAQGWVEVPESLQNRDPWPLLARGGHPGLVSVGWQLD